MVDDDDVDSKSESMLLNDENPLHLLFHMDQDGNHSLDLEEDVSMPSDDVLLPCLDTVDNRCNVV